MTELEKPKTTRKKKPPTQTAGVTGIDGHGAMGAAPIESPKSIANDINWRYLLTLPPFAMFVSEEAGITNTADIENWVNGRREALGDSVLYKKYADWHTNKGYWLNETPLGEII